MSNYADPAERFINYLEAGLKPTPKQYMQIAYELHAAMAPEPIMDHMTTSFELLGDAVSRAIRDEAEAASNEQDFCRMRTCLANPF